MTNIVNFSDKLIELYNQHSIPVKTLNNARQLGGYITKDNRRVKDDMLLRSSDLSKLSKEDEKILVENYNLKHVIDLRTPTEVENNPDAFINGVTNTWLKVAAFDNLTVMPAKFDIQSFVENASLLDEYFNAQDPKALYSDILTSEIGQIGYHDLFKVLLDNKSGSTLWHCSMGKDRAGLGAVLVLSVLGVDKETIIEDFELSNIAYLEMRKQLYSLLKDKIDNESLLDLSVTLISGVNKDFLTYALDIIDTEYGGMDSYLKNQIKLTDDDIATLKDMYTEEIK